jgi:chemotaxis protein methyltransferase CheR
MSDLNELQRIVHTMTGNVITDDKGTQLLDRLRQEAPGRTAPEIFADLLRWGALPNWLKTELTIGETFFFRHPQHFDALAAEARAHRGRRWEVLCAGVSSGEEGYSVAMTLADALPGAAMQVTGMDLNPAAVARARLGEYPEVAVQRTPAPYRELLRRHLEQVPDPSETRYRVRDALRASVRFVEGNLQTFSLATYDAVFVRNILIYFTAAAREALLQNLLRRLRVGGMILIGAGEVFPTALRAEGELVMPSILRRTR